MNIFLALKFFLAIVMLWPGQRVLAEPSLPRSMDWYLSNLESADILSTAARDALLLENQAKQEELIRLMELAITSPHFSGLKSETAHKHLFFRSIVMQALARAYYAKNLFSQAERYFSAGQSGNPFVDRMGQHGAIWSALASKDAERSHQMLRKLGPTTPHPRLDQEYQILLLAVRLGQNQILDASYLKSAVSLATWQPPWSEYLLLKAMQSEHHSLPQLLRQSPNLLHPRQIIHRDHLETLVLAYWQLAEAFEGRQYLQQLAAVIEKQEQNLFSELSLYLAIQSYDKLGEAKKKLALEQMYLRLFPRGKWAAPITRDLALASFFNGDYQLSMDHFKKLQEEASIELSFQAQYYTAWNLHRLGRHAEATQQLLELLRRPLPSLSREQWLLMLSEAAMFLTHLPDTSSALKIAANDQFRQPLLASSLGQHYIRQGNWKAFLGVFEHLLTRLPFEEIISNFQTVWLEELGDQLTRSMIGALGERVIVAAFQSQTESDLQAAFRSYGSRLTSIPAQSILLAPLSRLQLDFERQGDWQNYILVSEAILHHGAGQKGLLSKVYLLADLYGFGQNQAALRALLKRTQAEHSQLCCRLQRAMIYAGMWPEAWRLLSQQAQFENLDWSLAVRDLYFTVDQQEIKVAIEHFFRQHQRAAYQQRALAEITYRIFYNEEHARFLSQQSQWEKQLAQLREELRNKRLRDPFWQRLSNLGIIMRDEKERKQLALQYLGSSMVAIERDAVCELVARNQNFESSLADLLKSPISQHERWEDFQRRVEQVRINIREIAEQQQGACRRLQQVAIIPQTKPGLDILQGSLSDDARRLASQKGGGQPYNLGDFMKDGDLLSALALRHYFSDHERLYLDILERLYFRDLWNALAKLEKLADDSAWNQVRAVWQALIWTELGQKQNALDFISQVNRRHSGWEQTYIRRIQAELGVR